MDRRGKLRPGVQARIVEAIKAGSFAVVAAQYAGINETTYYRWIAKGKEAREAGRHTSPYAELLTAIEDAEATAEVFAVGQIRAAAQTNWTAAAWYLERKYPDRWGRRERVTHEGGSDDSKPIKVTFGGRYLPTGDHEAAPDTVA